VRTPGTNDKSVAAASSTIVSFPSKPEMLPPNAEGLRRTSFALLPLNAIVWPLSTASSDAALLRRDEVRTRSEPRRNAVFKNVDDDMWVFNGEFVPLIRIPYLLRLNLV
jgi:hypothetical protein